MTKNFLHDLTRHAVAVALGASIAGVPALAAEWDMPTGYGADSYQTRLAVRFADAVRAVTDGEVDIKVHSGGSMVAGGAIKDAVRSGKAQIGERLLSAHAAENSIYGIDAVPFLTANHDDVEALWAAARPAVEKSLAAEGLVLLYSVPWPPQGVYVNGAVNSVGDLAGKRLRVYNDSGKRMAAELGMQPVHVESANLTAALADGEVDAAITSGASGNDLRLNRYFDTYLDVAAWSPRNHVFVNQASWDSLTASQRQSIRAVANLIEELGAARVRHLTGWFNDRLEDGGMAVVKPRGNLAGELGQVGAELRDGWLGQAGAAGEQVLAAYEAAR